MAKQNPIGTRTNVMITIEQELWKAVKIAAVEEDTTASLIVQQALGQWLEQRQRSNQCT